MMTIKEKVIEAIKEFHLAHNSAPTTVWLTVDDEWDACADLRGWGIGIGDKIILKGFKGALSDNPEGAATLFGMRVVWRAEKFKVE